jgi:hypothetical protein
VFLTDISDKWALIDDISSPVRITQSQFIITLSFQKSLSEFRDSHIATPYSTAHSFSDARFVHLPIRRSPRGKIGSYGPQNGSPVDNVA